MLDRTLSSHSQCNFCVAFEAGSRKIVLNPDLFSVVFGVFLCVGVWFVVDVFFGFFFSLIT